MNYSVPPWNFYRLMHHHEISIALCTTMEFPSSYTPPWNFPRLILHHDFNLGLAPPGNCSHFMLYRKISLAFCSIVKSLCIILYYKISSVFCFSVKFLSRNVPSKNFSRFLFHCAISLASYRELVFLNWLQTSFLVHLFFYTSSYVFFVTIFKGDRANSYSKF